MKNDLPSGAKRYNGIEVRKMMDALRKKDIDFYERTQYCINGGVEYLRSFGAIESGDEWIEGSAQNKLLFNGEVSPTIESVWYYRSIAIPKRNGTILLYTPHMQPWRPEQRKETFQVFTIGKVRDEDILEVVKAYNERMGKHIDRVLEREGNEEKLKSVSLENLSA